MNKLQELELEEIEDILERAEDVEKFSDERFKIKDLDAANWAFRKLKAIDEKAKEITELAEKEMERIREWKENELEQINKSKEFFDFLLVEYYTEQRKVDPKFKLSTPYGKVSSRKQQPKWTYEDEKVIENLKTKGITDLIKVKEEIKKAELKKWAEILHDVVSLDGVIVEGIKFNEDIKAFIDTETGEIDSFVEDGVSDYEYHKQAIVYNGQVVEGITVQEQPDSVTVKVVE